MITTVSFVTGPNFSRFFTSWKKRLVILEHGYSSKCVLDLPAFYSLRQFSQGWSWCLCQLPLPAPLCPPLFVDIESKNKVIFLEKKYLELEIFGRPCTLSPAKLSSPAPIGSTPGTSPLDLLARMQRGGLSYWKLPIFRTKKKNVQIFWSMEFIC